MKRMKYRMRCKQCWKIVGISHHNFEDKVFFCSEECMEKFGKGMSKHGY